MNRLILGKNVDILNTHESGIISFFKPSGILSHPNSNNSNNSLLRCSYDFKKEAYVCDDSSFVYLLHRLDGPTSGVILATKDHKLSCEIKSLFKNRQINKTYFAIVKNNPGKNVFWSDLMNIQNEKNRILVHSGGNKIAKTSVNVQSVFSLENSVFSLVKLCPLTGFSHQLRFQCAKHKFPILGDQTYGNFQLNRSLQKNYGLKNLLLHSFSIEFEFNHESKKHFFYVESKLPDYFNVFKSMN